MDSDTPRLRVEGANVIISGEATVRSAALIRDALLRAFQSPGPVSVDLSELSHADLSFFQLLCAAHKKAVKEGREFALAGNSGDCVQSLADEIGFARSRSCFSGGAVRCCWNPAPAA